MKKLMAVVLAAMLALSMATVAFATDYYIGGTDNFSTATYIEPGSTIYIDAEALQSTSNSAYFLDSYNGEDFSAYLSSDYFTVSSLQYNTGASLVASAKVDDGYVVITLKDNYALKAPLVNNFEIKTLNVKARKAITKNGVTLPSSATFKLAVTAAQKVGWDDQTQSLGSVGSLSTPGYYIFKKSSTASYEDITFTDGDVELDFRAYDGDKFFLGISQTANLDLIKANPDTEIDFYTFQGNPTLSQSGTVYLSVEKGMYVYELKDGKLVSTNMKWNEDQYAFVGKFLRLPSLVVSDKRLSNVASASDSESESTSGSGNTNVTVPNTGPNDVVGLAVGLAAISLVAAGAVALKRKKK